MDVITHFACGAKTLKQLEAHFVVFSDKLAEMNDQWLPLSRILNSQRREDPQKFSQSKSSLLTKTLRASSDLMSPDLVIKHGGRLKFTVELSSKIVVSSEIS